jgi:hypothetical protein
MKQRLRSGRDAVMPLHSTGRRRDGRAAATLCSGRKASARPEHEQAERPRLLPAVVGGRGRVVARPLLLPLLLLQRVERGLVRQQRRQLRAERRLRRLARAQARLVRRRLRRGRGRGRPRQAALERLRGTSNIRF